MHRLHTNSAIGAIHFFASASRVGTAGEIDLIGNQTLMRHWEIVRKWPYIRSRSVTQNIVKLQRRVLVLTFSGSVWYKNKHPLAQQWPLSICDANYKPQLFTEMWVARLGRRTKLVVLKAQELHSSWWEFFLITFNEKRETSWTMDKKPVDRVRFD